MKPDVLRARDVSRRIFVSATVSTYRYRLRLVRWCRGAREVRVGAVLPRHTTYPTAPHLSTSVTTYYRAPLPLLSLPFPVAIGRWYVGEGFGLRLHLRALDVPVRYVESWIST